jgi:hypothetical protein
VVPSHLVSWEKNAASLLRVLTSCKTTLDAFSTHLWSFTLPESS